MSIKLNDTQLMLLSGASQRDDRHVSLPTGAKLAQARKVAAKLLEAGLVREVRARKDAPTWRRDQNAGQAYSLKLTVAGLKAIAVDNSNGVEEAVPQAPSAETIANGTAKAADHVEPGCAGTTPVSPRVGTKIGEVVAMLEGERGATLDQLVAVTGWLPHTTRAALTGLRKRGYVVKLDRSDRTHGSTYRIVSERSSDGSAEAAVTADSVVAGKTDPSESSAVDRPTRRVDPRATRSAAKARARKAA